MKFLQGFWTFLGPGSEKRWYGDSHDGQWARTANKIPSENGTPQPTAIQRVCHPVLWNPEEKERIRNYPLQWRFVKHRTLVPFIL